MNFGNKSEGDKLVKITAKINKIIYKIVIGFGWITIQIPTPTKAIIYVGDSDPVLKITVKIRTEANNINRKACCLYCEIRKYCNPKRTNPDIKIGIFEI